MVLVAPRYSYRLPAYLAACETTGIRALIASEGELALSARWPGVRCPFDRPDAAAQIIHAALGPAGAQAVVATDDSATEIAAHLAAALSLPHNPPAAMHASRRKDRARAVLASHGLAVPDHRVVQLRRPVAPQCAEAGWPVVIKPLAMAGSRGVIRADDAASLEAAATRVARIVAESGDEYEREHALVEAFVDGPEFALEAVLRDGEIEVLAIFDKPEPMNGPYFEETYYISPARIDAVTRRALIDSTRAACAAYGLRHGPVHAELRMHDGRAWIMEVAARTIGGDCARLVEHATGRTLESIVIGNALGLEHTLPEMTGAAGVLMLPIPAAGMLRRVEGLLNAQAVDGVNEVRIAIQPGNLVTPLPEGSSYLGFVFATGADADRVERALRHAHAQLKFVIAPLLPAGLSVF